MDEEIIFVEEQPDPWWRRPFVIILAVFLLLLTVSTSVFGFGLEDRIASWLLSPKVEEGTIEGHVAVVFENGTLGKIQDLYLENQEHETKMCLQGYIEEQYHVTYVFEPVIIAQDYSSVLSERCPTNTLIALHTHPYRRCFASAQDMRNLEELQETNPEIAIGIMCDLDRFQFYA